MADIHFEEDQTLTPSGGRDPRRGSITLWLVEKGIAKDERKASYILLGVAGAALVLMLLVLGQEGGGGIGPSGRTPIPAGTVQPHGFSPSP